MLANYLKDYFIKHHITQYEIEKKTGIDRCKINLSLNGKRKLTAEELIKIATEFQMDLNKLKEIK